MVKWIKIFWEPTPIRPEFWWVGALLESTRNNAVICGSLKHFFTVTQDSYPPNFGQIGALLRAKRKFAGNIWSVFFVCLGDATHQLLSQSEAGFGSYGTLSDSCKLIFFFFLNKTQCKCAYFVINLSVRVCARPWLQRVPGVFAFRRALICLRLLKSLERVNLYEFISA